MKKFFTRNGAIVIVGIIVVMLLSVIMKFEVLNNQTDNAQSINMKTNYSLTYNDSWNPDAMGITSEQIILSAIELANNGANQKIPYARRLYTLCRCGN